VWGHSGNERLNKIVFAIVSHVYTDRKTHTDQTGFCSIAAAGSDSPLLLVA